MPQRLACHPDLTKAGYKNKQILEKVVSLIVDARCDGGGGGGGGATPVMSSLVLVIYLSGFKSPWLPVESNQIEMRLRVLSASDVWCQWSESNQIECECVYFSLRRALTR